MFDIRHKEEVRLILRSSDFQPVVGTIGVVLAMKLRDGKAEYLVKWKGRSSPCVAWRAEVERV